ncbi:tryptophan synthase beta chain [Marinobacterium nitratireducens]|uniref:Tryptophan synthase beta chain n=1 Tax=Marinobacterium nitratireducens TaxID=518897 RepID=A0A917ZQK3_9GAMM|nr:tryptophan synthase subunit beta [Marinobacterium nitratireducens]GGO88447.1 tryptophan synthase beta chain [Marinobacterium nitratireducens]
MKSDQGFYGRFGGSYIPEILHASQRDLLAAWQEASEDPAFMALVDREMQQYSGRPTPLTPCPNLSRALGGARIYLKREDLNHSGAHKMNNVIGQGLLVKRMGKKRIIAETGAGQHGVASALIAARLGLDCTVYMGARDIERQYPNVFWMKQLGATVVPVTSGGQTLRDALDEALRDWSADPSGSHYLIGTACGPAPYPEMVAQFQSVIGREVRQQSLAQFGALPDRIYACVGGGSNAAGILLPFLDDPEVELVGIEAGGRGKAPGEHSIRLSDDLGSPGIAQGFSTMFLQDDQGQLMDTHSVAAGLDYVGVSPILAHLAEAGRIRMDAASDDETMAAFGMLLRHEGVIPALESAHAVAGALREAPQLSPEQRVVINVSGRGDKDIFNVASALQDPEFTGFLQRYLEREAGR